MSIDGLFSDLAFTLRHCPSVVVSLLSFCFCAVAVRFFGRHFGYAGLCAYMVVVGIISNIQALYATSYELLNMAVLLGAPVFCSSFLACDLINLEHGAAKAKNAVYLSMFMNVLFIASMILTLGHKPIDYAQYPAFGISKETMDANIGAMEQLFTPLPRILIASYAAYLVSQLSEIWLFNAVNRIRCLKSEIVKHNISLFISNVCLDTLVFTLVGMWILASEPLTLMDIWQVCSASIAIRIICNFGISIYMKWHKHVSAGMVK
ncbi:MAG: queuosine precursor transporter [Alphaproteobacteria bacterium]|nr:queuosine precursor transporter [Alphaproteobacteria bacterium]